MRTCSNASLGALLDDRRTRMLVGLGGTAATVDIDTLAWKKNKDQREEAGQEDAPPDTREQINVERSGEQPVLRLPSFRWFMSLFRPSKVLRLLRREDLELGSDCP
jgi:hypothetical protein